MSLEAMRQEVPRPPLLKRLRTPRAVIIAGLALVLVLCLAYLVAGRIIFDQLSCVGPPSGVDAANTPAGFNVTREEWQDFDTTPYLLPQYETVRFASRDAGVSISGWYIEKADDAPVVILVHGIGTWKGHHTVLIPAGMVWRAGFSALLIDMREHGESTVEDGRTAFGNEEYLDVLGAWDWLTRERGVPPQRIGLLGISLGASTVLTALGEEPRVAAAFVDSPFSDLRQIVAEELAGNGYPTFLAPAGILMARLTGGVDLLAHSPADGVRRLGERRLYLVHGLADSRIGPHHARRLVDIAEEQDADVTAWYVPEADHVEAMLMHPDGYRERLVGFFSEALGR
jgi:dipeptidyl aminopeptidase/acylaminoacyl peptidase